MYMLQFAYLVCATVKYCAVSKVKEGGVPIRPLVQGSSVAQDYREGKMIHTAIQQQYSTRAMAVKKERKDISTAPHSIILLSSARHAPIQHRKGTSNIFNAA